uniref:Uncharacterized protein n=1 Tax=Rhizophora mucronata TaxID=61149 RepID=A0A2P2QLG3_RHIMU
MQQTKSRELKITSKILDSNHNLCSSSSYTCITMERQICIDHSTLRPSTLLIISTFKFSNLISQAFGTR